VTLPSSSLRETGLTFWGSHHAITGIRISISPLFWPAPAVLVIPPQIGVPLNYLEQSSNAGVRGLYYTTGESFVVAGGD